MSIAAILALSLLTQQEMKIDWASLPGLPFRVPPVVTPAMNQFAGREARSRKCPLPAATSANQTLTVDVAVLIDGDGNVRTVVPKAIACATVEQYAAGLAAGFARSNLLPRPGAAEQWYKTTVTFTWRK